MREEIAQALSNPKATAVVTSVFFGQWVIEWGSLVLQLVTSLLGIAALSVSLAVNLQTFFKNRREAKLARAEKLAR